MLTTYTPSKSRMSFIITSHNYRRFLAAAVASCLEQKTDVPFEVIIIDDHSTDGSYEAAQEWAKQRPNLCMGQCGKRGLENACNYGLTLAQGAYVVRVDADDVLRPQYLAQVLPVIERERCAFVYPEYVVIDQEGYRCTVDLPDFDPAEIRARGDFMATGTLYDWAAVMGVGAYNTQKTNCGLENYRLILALLQAGYRGVCVHDALFAYRIHGQNWSTAKRAEIMAYGRALADEFSLPGGYQINDNHPLRSADIPLAELVP